MQRKIYLLTCWQEGDGPVEKDNWRFNLESPDGKESRLFVHLQEVVVAIGDDLVMVTENEKQEEV